MDLFEHQQQQLAATQAPLAARMRPRSLDEFVGQSNIIGPGRLLRRAIEADQLSSLIFYGPPGTGKTTLARVIANTTQAKFLSINAVLGGIKEIRQAIEQAQTFRGQYGQRTILFVDEVHRFNKAQQDALLPWVENGTVVLIGATTENPYFEVNKALLSRSRIFQLKSLSANDLADVLQQVLTDVERGYGDRNIRIEADAQAHLINIANGDARTLLNALELAVETTPVDSQGVVQITLAVAEDSIQQRAVLYDKEGDVHFDTISAFIKSVRGSDPDAALYWLARMIYAGEDPRYIFRRLVILASEDVGLADPHAVSVVTSCADAFDRVGMPEGRYPLAQATLHLATAPKSNSTMAFFDALAAVEREREAEVPGPMRDANRDKKGFGHGAGYLYPHAYRDHWVAQQYLPSSLQGQVFYQPSDQGYEASICAQVTRRREAQLAGLLEMDRARSLVPIFASVAASERETLTLGPDNPVQDRWLQRATSQLGEQLGQVRDRIFSALEPQRHHVLLDLNANSGLLTWEAVRQVPEGGVYSCTYRQQDYQALTEQAAALADETQPQILLTTPAAWQCALGQLASQGAAVPSKFDGIIGRKVLTTVDSKLAVVRQIAGLLDSAGRVVLAEDLPHRAQRLCALIEHSGISPSLYQKLATAEEQIYHSPLDAHLSWDIDDLKAVFEQAKLQCDIQVVSQQRAQLITTALLKRWLDEPGKYRQALSAQGLSKQELKAVRSHFQTLKGQTVPWQQTIAFVFACHKSNSL